MWLLSIIGFLLGFMVIVFLLFICVIASVVGIKVLKTIIQSNAKHWNW